MGETEGRLVFWEGMPACYKATRMSSQYQSEQVMTSRIQTVKHFYQRAGLFQYRRTSGYSYNSEKPWVDHGIYSTLIHIGSKVRCLIQRGLLSFLPLVLSLGVCGTLEPQKILWGSVLAEKRIENPRKLIHNAFLYQQRS